MNDISMCLFPLDNGRLINVLQIMKVYKALSGDYYIWFVNKESEIITESEYNRLKQLYCPPTQTVL